MPSPHRSDRPSEPPAEPPLLSLTVPQLAYLVAVADHETFAEAAASLGVTTSALSQGLAELERRCGVDLFERVGRRQVLRDDAAEVLAHARRVVTDTRDLARMLADRHAGRAGRLRVGMIDAAAVTHLPDRLRAFRTSAPDVDLHLVVAPSGPLLEQVRRGDLDLAVVVAPEEEEGLEVEPLLTESIVVVAPEGAAIGPPSSWGPWVLFPRGSHTRALVEAELVRRGAPVEVEAESHQPEVLREMARLGMGWTALPEAQAGVLTTREVLTRRHLVAVRRRDRVPVPAADRLLAHLRSDPDHQD